MRILTDSKRLMIECLGSTELQVWSHPLFFQMVSQNMLVMYEHPKMAKYAADFMYQLLLSKKVKIEVSFRGQQFMTKAYDTYKDVADNHQDTSRFVTRLMPKKGLYSVNLEDWTLNNASMKASNAGPAIIRRFHGNGTTYETKSYYPVGQSHNTQFTDPPRDDLTPFYDICWKAVQDIVAENSKPGHPLAGNWLKVAQSYGTFVFRFLHSMDLQTFNSSLLIPDPCSRMVTVAMQAETLLN